MKTTLQKGHENIHYNNSFTSPHLKFEYRTGRTSRSSGTLHSLHDVHASTSQAQLSQAQGHAHTSWNKEQLLILESTLHHTCLISTSRPRPFLHDDHSRRE